MVEMGFAKVKLTNFNFPSVAFLYLETNNCLFSGSLIQQNGSDIARRNGIGFLDFGSALTKIFYLSLTLLLRIINAECEIFSTW